MINNPQLAILEKQNQAQNRFGTNLASMYQALITTNEKLDAINTTMNTVAHNTGQTIHSKAKEKFEQKYFSDFNTNFSKYQDKIDERLEKLEEREELQKKWYEKIINKINKNFNEAQQEWMADRKERTANWHGLNPSLFNLMSRPVSQVTRSAKTFEDFQQLIFSSIYELNRQMLIELVTIRKSSASSATDNIRSSIEKEETPGLMAKISSIGKSLSKSLPGGKFAATMLDYMLDPMQMLTQMQTMSYNLKIKAGLLHKERSGVKILGQAGLGQSSQDKAYGYIANALPKLLDELRTVEYKQLEVLENIFDSIGDVGEALTGQRRELNTTKYSFDKERKNYDGLTGQYLDKAEYDRVMKKRKQQIEEDIERRRGIIGGSLANILSKVGLAENNESIIKKASIGLENTTKANLVESQRKRKYQMAEQDEEEKSSFRKFGNLLSIGGAASLGPLSLILGPLLTSKVSKNIHRGYGSQAEFSEIANETGATSNLNRSGKKTTTGSFSFSDIYYELISIEKILDEKIYPAVDLAQESFGNLYSLQEEQLFNLQLLVENTDPIRKIYRKLSSKEFEGVFSRISDVLLNENPFNNLFELFSNKLTLLTDTIVSRVSKIRIEIVPGSNARLIGQPATRSEGTPGWVKIKDQHFIVGEDPNKGYKDRENKRAELLSFEGNKFRILNREQLKTNAEYKDLNETFKNTLNKQKEENKFQTMWEGTGLALNMDTMAAGTAVIPHIASNNPTQVISDYVVKIYEFLAQKFKRDEAKKKQDGIKTAGKTSEQLTEEHNKVIELNTEQQTKQQETTNSLLTTLVHSAGLSIKKKLGMDSKKGIMENIMDFLGEHPIIATILGAIGTFGLFSGGNLIDSLFGLNKKDNRTFMEKVADWFKPGAKGGFFSAISTATKYALTGATIGFFAAGPIGAIGGALIGGALGGIIGWLGGDEIQKRYNKLKQDLDKEYITPFNNSIVIPIQNFFDSITPDGVSNFFSTQFNDIKEKGIGAKLAEYFSSDPNGGMMSAIKSGGKYAIAGAGIGLFLGPIGVLGGALIGGAIGLIAGYFGQNKINDKKQEFFEKYKDQIQEYIYDPIDDYVLTPIREFKYAFEDFQGDKSVTTSLTQLSTEAWGLKGIITDLFRPKGTISTTIKETTEGIGRVIKSGFTNEVTILAKQGQVAKSIASPLTETFRTLWESKGLMAAIKESFHGAGIFEGIKNIFKDGKIFSGLWQGIKNIFATKSIWSSIFEGREILTAIKSTFSIASKSNPITSVIFGVIDMVTDAFSIFKAEGSFSGDALFRALLGGSDEGGWMSAFKGMGKWGAMGAAAGATIGGILIPGIGMLPGAGAGAMIGSAIGFVLGYFGNFKIEETASDLWNGLGKLFKGIGKTWDEGYAEGFKKYGILGGLSGGLSNLVIQGFLLSFKTGIGVFKWLGETVWSMFKGTADWVLNLFTKWDWGREAKIWFDDFTYSVEDSIRGIWDTLSGMFSTLPIMVGDFINDMIPDGLRPYLPDSFLNWADQKSKMADIPAKIADEISKSGTKDDQLKYIAQKITELNSDTSEEGKFKKEQYQKYFDQIDRDRQHDIAHKKLIDEMNQKQETVAKEDAKEVEEHKRALEVREQKKKLHKEIGDLEEQIDSLQDQMDNEKDDNKKKELRQTYDDMQRQKAGMDKQYADLDVAYHEGESNTSKLATIVNKGDEGESSNPNLASSQFKVNVDTKDGTTTSNINTENINLSNYQEFIHGDSNTNFTGLLPGFKKRLIGAAMDYKKATGKKLSLTSGYRSIAEQQILWDRSGHNRKAVAPPGNSAHNWGFAVDFDFNGKQVEELRQMGLLTKWGLHTPLHPPLNGSKDETWHVEPIELKQGRFAVLQGHNDANLAFLKDGSLPQQNNNEDEASTSSQPSLSAKSLETAGATIVQQAKDTAQQAVDGAKELAQKGSDMAQQYAPEATKTASTAWEATKSSAMKLKDWSTEMATKVGNKTSEIINNLKTALQGHGNAFESDKYMGFLAGKETEFGLPKGLLGAVMAQESKGNPTAFNPGAKDSGLFQIIPKTGMGLGLKVSSQSEDVANDERYDPFKAGSGAAKLLKDNFNILKKKFPNKSDDEIWKGAIYAYNWGPNAASKYLTSGVKSKSGDPDYYEHVSQYWGKTPLPPTTQVADSSSRISEGSSNTSSASSEQSMATNISQILSYMATGGNSLNWDFSGAVDGLNQTPHLENVGDVQLTQQSKTTETVGALIKDKITPNLNTNPNPTASSTMVSSNALNPEFESMKDSSRNVSPIAADTSASVKTAINEHTNPEPVEEKQPKPTNPTNSNNYNIVNNKVPPVIPNNDSSGMSHTIDKHFSATIDKQFSLTEHYISENAKVFATGQIPHYT